MVFVIKGMRVGIPPGGLVIRADGTVEPVVLHVGVDMWSHWIREGMRHLEQCQAAAAEVDAFHQIGKDDHTGDALQREAVAGMQAVNAAAFAVDAFYAAVKHRADIPVHVTQAWRKARTSRPAQVVETLRRCYKFNNRDAIALRQMIVTLFRARDRAVHPPADLSPAITHPRLESGVEWRFIMFSAESAHNAVLNAITVARRCTIAPRTNIADELRTWTASAEMMTAQLVGEWSAAQGPLP